MLVVKFSRQPTEETLDGSKPGRNHGKPAIKEEGRNVDEILRADAEQDAG